MKKARILLLLITMSAASGGVLAFKATVKYGSVLYTTSIWCQPATKTATATTTIFGQSKVYVTFIYNQPACLYTYTVFRL
jgi:hypothetical protein